MGTRIINSAVSLAAQLAQERDSILAKWREDMATSGEASLVKTLSRTEFYDGIPDFLEHFGAILRGDNRTVDTSARQHGAHRWQQGLDFDEVILEWNVLHRIVFERVTALWQTSGYDLASLQHSYWLLADAVQQAIGSSLVEFHQHKRLEADARRRDLEAVLQQRDDLEQRRGEGLRQASHDLRGSLQIAQLSCRALKRRDLDRQTGVIVERLSHAVDGLGQIFNDLLELARLEAGRDECRISDVDAAALLRELCETMEPVAETRGLSLRIDGADALPVRSDATKLHRIAQNLILNALKYTTAGSVEIGWQTEPPSYWSFYVRDSGPGMPDSTADALVEAFEDAANGDERKGAQEANGYSTSRQPQTHGEGVGLAIVHRLCVLLDAVLDVDSKSGRGTTFRIRLPL